jgi:hypothetical protein
LGGHFLSEIGKIYSFEGGVGRLSVQKFALKALQLLPVGYGLTNYGFKTKKIQNIKSTRTNVKNDIVVYFYVYVMQNIHVHHTVKTKLLR